MKVRFTADYDHKWPSRAMTAFKAGYEGTVKREVGERAISKGKATEVRNPDTAAGDAAASTNADMGRSRGMAEPHNVDHVGTSVRRAQLDGAGQ
ncbi:hypothetical protein [Sphingobium sp. ZW T5_29]|uniref:hypothetical protein n=1 Tax=Sphingobium sp. ZW T5_29 TaxID=3378077 RepID=UPI0038528C3D